MNYKAGDTVVCIDAKSAPTENTNLLKAGNKYTVRFTSDRCTSVEEVCQTEAFHAYAAKVGGMWSCGKCGTECDPYPHYSAWRFIKLDPLFKEEERFVRRGLPQKAKEALGIA